MSDAVITRAMDGAALAPITANQRRELAILARRAFEKLYDAGQISESTEFDTWRHQQAIQAVERPGLRDCRQEDFAQLKSHFLRLLGNEAMATRMQARADTDARRVAMWKLEQACKDVQDVISNPNGYLMSICRARFKTLDFDRLSAKQVWVLVFDLRRNAQRRRKREVSA